MRDVALKVPLGGFTLGRSRQRHDPSDTWTQVLGDALDDTALTGGVAALEDDDDLQALMLDPFLKLDELELQIEQLLLVLLVAQAVLLRGFFSAFGFSVS